MIYIGTSGFSYEDWKGHFYPESVDKKNMLSYYSSAFNSVEINSTYYAIPSAASVAAMDRKTPESFRFAVKAHKDMTHAETPVPESFDAFLRAIQPLRDSGKLGCILAQFPWSFRHSPENAGRLADLRARMKEVPTVVEFRNSEWVNDETFGLLTQLGLGFCSVDEPGLKGLMPRIAAATSSVGYVRFHGRNAKKWWKHDEAWERYDYLYSEDELSEWTPRVTDIAARTEHTYVFFNNHYQGKSAQNARMLAKMLGLGFPSDSPHPPAGQMTLGSDF